MRAYYDFTKMKCRKNPYAAMLKRPITIRVDNYIVAYFKHMAVELGIPYQSLINLYLRDCALHQRKLRMNWKPQRPRRTHRP
jgi:predicted DNA binding CopG/RHH family protein